MEYLVYNDWEGKSYLTNDRKSAVKLGNKMIEDFKNEFKEKGSEEDMFEYSESNFRNSNFKCCGWNDWKYEIDITLMPIVKLTLSNEEI